MRCHKVIRRDEPPKQSDEPPKELKSKELKSEKREEDLIEKRIKESETPDTDNDYIPEENE